MKLFLFAIMILLAGCSTPASPTPPLAPPIISGAFTPAPTAPISYPATPRSVYYGYPSTYGVMLCYQADAVNALCWFPPTSSLKVQ